MSSEPDKKNGQSHSIPILVALIGLIGVLGAALITNWDKLFSPKKQETQTNVTISENLNSTAPDNATVSLEAKITNMEGDILLVRAEKFYLLDEDLESILGDADIENTDGHGLVNAFGLSVLFPERYSEINKKALNEIKKHIVYDTLTDSTGKAQIKNVKPGSYYLFGITKSENGFAVWSSHVTINPGQNALNLSPAKLKRFINV